MSLPWNVVAMVGIHLERHGGSLEATAMAPSHPASDSLTHQSLQQDRFWFEVNGFPPTSYEQESSVYDGRLSRDLLDSPVCARAGIEGAARRSPSRPAFPTAGPNPDERNTPAWPGRRCRRVLHARRRVRATGSPGRVAQPSGGRCCFSHQRWRARPFSMSLDWSLNQGRPVSGLAQDRCRAMSVAISAPVSSARIGAT